MSQDSDAMVNALDELPAWAMVVVHARCQARYRVERGDPDNGLPTHDGDRLCCEDCEVQERGQGFGGFIALRRLSVSDMLPAPLDNAWVPMPHLGRHRRALGLTSNEMLVVGCLWDHGAGSGVAYPSEETIAEETGLGKRTVARTIADLEGRAHRPDGKGGREPADHPAYLIVDRDPTKANRYDLAQLWDVLAAQVQKTTPGATGALVGDAPVAHEVEPPTEGESRAAHVTPLRDVGHTTTDTEKIMDDDEIDWEGTRDVATAPLPRCSCPPERPHRRDCPVMVMAQDDVQGPDGGEEPDDA